MQAPEIVRVCAAILQLGSISGGARPRLGEFRAERHFPATVLGPLDFRALRRLAASRAALETAFPLWSTIRNSMTSFILLSSLFFEAS